MKKTLFLLVIFLFSNCKSENTKDKISASEIQKMNSEIAKDNNEFQAFINQFPTKTLPVIINGCENKILDSPKLDIRLSSKYVTEPKYEHIYGRIPSNGNYISIITIGEADCLIPILNTYKPNGEKIDSKAMNIGYCGPDPCYECVENFTITRKYRIYVADTIKSSDCDENFKSIAGTEKIKVIYKEGKVTETGLIVLSQEKEKK